MKISVWYRVAFVNFIIAALIGTLLRFAFVYEVPWLTFRYFLHAHSHVAMLGWIYLSLFSLLLVSFTGPDLYNTPVFSRLFWLTQLSVIGMLVSFPFQGYGLVAIFFSTTHIILSYIFCFQFLKKVKTQFGDKRLLSLKFVRAAVFFMIFSTLGVWGLGLVIALGYEQTAIYYMAIQFFLHFQFNGWFLFAILALFFRWLEYRGIRINQKKALAFFNLLFLSCLLTYALAITWTNPILSVFIINSVGVLIQLVALIFFLLVIWPVRKLIIGVAGDGLNGFLLRLSLVSLVMKILVQTFVVTPFLATMAYTIRNYVIGFLHLILLGAVSFFIFARARTLISIPAKQNLDKLGLYLFIFGFIATEILLVLQGSMFWAAMGLIPGYYEILFGFTLFLPTGLLCMLLARIKNISLSEN